jgi:hypothetical protein
MRLVALGGTGELGRGRPGVCPSAAAGSGIAAPAGARRRDETGEAGLGPMPRLPAPLSTAASCLMGVVDDLEEKADPRKPARSESDRTESDFYAAEHNAPV